MATITRRGKQVDSGAVTTAWGVPVPGESAGAVVSAPDEGAGESDSDRIAVMLTDMANDTRAYVNLHRLDRGKWVWCCKYRPDEYEAGGLEMIREQWGHGEYVVRLYGTVPETGYFGIRASSQINIAQVRGAASPVPTPTAGDNLSGAIEKLGDMMMRQNEALMTALSNRPDPMAQFQQMMTMMAAMRQAMGDTNGRSGGIGELAKEISALRELARDLNPPQETDPMAEQLPKVIELIKLGMSQRSPEPPANLPPVSLPPSMAQQNPIADNPTPENNEGKQMDLMRMAHVILDEIIARQSRGDSVESIVAYMDGQLGALPDHEYDSFCELLEHSQWFDLLKQVFPHIEPHKDGLTKVRDAFMAEDESEHEANRTSVHGTPPGPERD